jgi:drug/metabolite transporter (DMT)-like permease
LAVLLSVLTAFLYAMSNVLELLEAEQVPDEYAMRAGLMTRLVRRPRWLLGLLSDFAGYLCQAAALGLAAVVFVEPILATGVLMAMLLAAAFTRRHIHAVDWIGAGVLSAGLAVFLYEVSPTGGIDVAPTDRWFTVGPLVIGTICVCLIAARSTHGPKRAALLGTAAGVSFGVSALLTKALMHYLGDGVFAWVPHWEPYALALTAIGGVVIAQSAFQTGALAASVGSTEATAPLSAAVLGLVLLNEHVTTDTAAQAFAVIVSVAAILWAILALARAEEHLLGTDAFGDLALGDDVR